MGPDDHDISWSGRFQGLGATGKAMALDQLRKAGAQLPLALDNFGTMNFKPSMKTSAPSSRIETPTSWPLMGAVSPWSNDVVTPCRFTSQLPFAAPH
jgi:hypothetical protein